MLTAILVISGATLFTACTSDDDNLGPDTKKLVGQWKADVTGATQVLWGEGKALRMTELNSDGTGCTDIYYLLNDAIIRYEDVNWTTEQVLPHYTLSVCLVDHDTYNFDFMNHYQYLDPVCNFNEGYEQTRFHKVTGWGTWLNTNRKLPKGNPSNGGVRM